MARAEPEDATARGAPGPDALLLVDASAVGGFAKRERGVGDGGDRRVGTVRRGFFLRRPGVEVDAPRARRGASRDGEDGGVRRRAEFGFLRARRGEGFGAARGGHHQQRHGDGEPGSRGGGGEGERDASDHPHRRPAARAPRHRREPDDRPGEDVRGFRDALRGPEPSRGRRAGGASRRRRFARRTGKPSAATRSRGGRRTSTANSGTPSGRSPASGIASGTWSGWNGGTRAIGRSRRRGAGEAASAASAAVGDRAASRGFPARFLPSARPLRPSRGSSA